MILGAMDQKIWVFEVLRRSLGRAKVVEEKAGHVLEPTSKSWPLVQKMEGRKKKTSKKMGTAR
jgi:hypothetical protein